MSDESSAQPAAVSVPIPPSVVQPDTAMAEFKDVAVADNTSNGVESAVNQGTEPLETESKDSEKKVPEQASASTIQNITGPAADSEMVLAPESAADGVEDSTIDGTPSSGKLKARRKSSGVPEHKSKKLTKKASKVKMNHVDAKPGDHYFIKLKGYPLWPGIICDESMLPQTLLKSRPVTAANENGTYRADYEDGGKKVTDRTFPVMYLYTNEFGWMPNYDLLDLNPETVLEGINDKKMRHDLLQAYTLASENHDLSYYKKVLQDFQDQRQAEAEAKAAAKAAKHASKGKKKSKAAAEVEDENEDVEMADADADGEVDVDVEAEAVKPKLSKKRKAVADADDATSTPQRTDSVKKPKIKLNTPKANGSATPKSNSKKDPASTKTSKPKAKKAAQNGVEPAEQTPPEPEQSAEEKRAKKEREILFLRHKLQKGLLTRDQQPKEEEMKQMSEFISKLEGYADLEVSIIRATKINKVLKAILKLEEIPKEAEFMFKERSQGLLGKWNKILESDTTVGSVPANGAKDGANGSSADAEDKESKPTETLKNAEEPIEETSPVADPETAIKAMPTKDETNVKVAAAEAKPVADAAT